MTNFVLVDPVKRRERGLPEKVSLSEELVGTEACYMSEAEGKLYDETHKLVAEAVDLVNKAERAEERSYKLRREAGLKLVELRRVVREADVAWDGWFKANVHGVSRATAYRYMAMASEPELDPIVQPSGQPSEQPTVTAGEPARETVSCETVKKTGALRGKQVSAKTEINKLVKGLSERRAGELLAVVKAWAERLEEEQ
jgi:hypothetical protein